MESGDHSHPIDVMEFTAKPRDRRGASQERLSGKFPETADDLRANRRNLTLQERTASKNFVRLGIAVVRRPAFQDIADIDILTFDACGFDDLRQQLAGSSDKRQTLLVLFITRCF